MRTHTPRAGFTLVELLTVIGILALLASLVAAGIVKVRGAQLQRNAEQTLVKLQMTLDQQWKALADKVGLERSKNRIDGGLVNYCKTTPPDSKEGDRAAALYMYMLTRNEFPQNFAEAVTAVPNTGNFGGFRLPARKVYDTVQQVDTNQPVRVGSASGRILASTVSTETQSAVLLYLTLAEKSLEGTVFNADDATQSAQTELFFTQTAAFGSGSISFRVFADPWGTPIAYTRYTQDGLGGELNAAPYTGSSAGKDPLDTRQLLTTASWTNRNPAQTQLGVTVYNANGFQTITAGGGGTPTPVALFDNKNKQPSVFSAGPDRQYVDTSLPANQQNLFGGDNLAGFKLRTLGARAD